MNGMTRKTILVAALAAGILTTVLVYFLLAAQGMKAQQGNEPVPVVISDVELSPGTIIEPTMVHMGTRFSRDVPKDCATSVREVEGKVAIATIPADMPVQRSQMVPISAKLGLAFAVPEGMRAVTVALDPIIGVGGFIKPGNRVDVLATFTEDKGSLTKTVLQDVQLLATGERVLEEQATPDGKAARPQPIPHATLAVAPADAEKLILAESKGKLRLALRRTGDIEYAEVRGISSVALIGRVPQPPSSSGGGGAAARVVYQPGPAFTPGLARPPFTLAPSQVQQVAPGQKSVEIYRGTEKEVVTVAE